MNSDARLRLPTRRHLVFGAACLLVVSSACSSDDSGSASSEAPSADSTDAAPDGTDAGLDLEGIERGVLTFRMATVGDPGNPSVGVTTMFGESGDFVDTANGATYESCDDAPADAPTNCITSGAVDYEYEIGELEVTVGQYVTFLNTVDPEGSNRRELFIDYMSPVVWPKYGSIDYTADAPAGEHYAVAAPEWTDKPFGFADFLRSARFVNALFNGDVVSSEESSEDGFDFVTYEVRLSRETEKGMYDLTKRDTPRTADSGFVVPSYDEWMKAAYYDPDGGGEFSYWTYPTGPTDAPNVSQLDPRTGDVTNADDQPLSTYNPNFPSLDPGDYPTWCPSTASDPACETGNPINVAPGLDYKFWQGNLSTVGQTETPSPWGTKDMGGNVVEWQDTIVDPPPGYDGKLPDDRVWRRMHGGVANAQVYQLAIGAIGFQPQDQAILDSVYPWFGLRIGFVPES